MCIHKHVSAVNCGQQARLRTQKKQLIDKIMNVMSLGTLRSGCDCIAYEAIIIEITIKLTF